MILNEMNHAQNPAPMHGVQPAVPVPVAGAPVQPPVQPPVGQGGDLMSMLNLGDDVNANIKNIQALLAMSTQQPQPAAQEREQSHPGNADAQSAMAAESAPRTVR